jgi:predicted nucleotidyltransferase
MCSDAEELCGIPAVQPDWIAEFISQLKATLKLKGLILFGSRARGEHLTWSDYDVCVISDDFADQKPWERMELVLEKWSGGRALEPLCYTEEEFERIQGTTIGQVITQGKRLYP